MQPQLPDGCRLLHWLPKHAGTLLVPRLHAVTATATVLQHGCASSPCSCARRLPTSNISALMSNTVTCPCSGCCCWLGCCGLDCCGCRCCCCCSSAACIARNTLKATSPVPPATSRCCMPAKGASVFTKLQGTYTGTGAHSQPAGDVLPRAHRACVA